MTHIILIMTHIIIIMTHMIQLISTNENYQLIIQTNLIKALTTSWHQVTTGKTTYIIMRHCYHYDSLINKLEKILEKSKPAENQNPIDRRFTFDVGVNEGKETKLLTFQVYHETRLDKNIHINPRLKTNTNTRNGRRNLGRVRPEIIEISTGNSHPEWPRSIWASMIIL